MPDISMCENEECPLRHRCYRFMAEPDDYCQAYTAFAIGVDGECEGFRRMPYSNKKPRCRMDGFGAMEARHG